MACLLVILVIVLAVILLAVRAELRVGCLADAADTFVMVVILDALYGVLIDDETKDRSCPLQLEPIGDADAIKPMRTTIM
jgi:uncharacterized membrane protein YwaF